MELDSAVNLGSAEAVGYRSYLFYGPGGSGKTTLAARHKGLGLFIDMDERLHELYIPTSVQERITVWKPNVPLGSSLVEISSVDPTRKNVYSKGTKIGEEPQGYRKLVRVINELLGLAYKGEFKYNFVVLDSLTRVTQHLEYLVMYQHGTSNMTETLYGVLKRNMLELMFGFLKLPCDRIVIAHSKHIEKRDRDTNVILQSYTRPNVIGSLAEELISYFSEAYYFLGRKGDEPVYEIQTVSDRELAARTCNPFLNARNPADPERVFA